jgi:hypothetical protein
VRICILALLVEDTTGLETFCARFISVVSYLASKEHDSLLTEELCYGS